MDTLLAGWTLVVKLGGWERAPGMSFGQKIDAPNIGRGVTKQNVSCSAKPSSYNTGDTVVVECTTDVGDVDPQTDGSVAFV